MIEIKNLMFQPLTFHLAGSGQSLYLNPRERRAISEEKISPEIKMAEKRGFVSFADIGDPTEDTPPASAPAVEPSPPEAESPAKTAPRRKRR
ncbi:MAG TPA: hypothetical protein VM658_13495 [bacterium]|nr:hypothetical protein [bacterium]